MEICKVGDENRNLHCQLACVVLLEAMEKDGAVLPDGVVGNQIKHAVEIMDGSGSKSNQHSVMDNLQLTDEHLVFKLSSIDPRAKCSEIVVSVNVTKVTSSIITSVIIALHDSVPMVGLEVGMAMSDAAGCNWVSYRDTIP
jgi:hypothetical protein